MTGPIYQPSGRAREYSPYALNVYSSCTHGCKYCYVPRCLHLKDAQYFKSPSPRVGIVEALRRQLFRERFDSQVLMSFVGDCFCETSDNSAAAIDCLRLLSESGTPTAVLTKGGKRIYLAEDAIMSFRRNSIAIGTTLTFSNDKDSHEWEPGASSPDERIEMLSHFHALGVRTFASFEPVIDPNQSVDLMRRCAELGVVDVYKVGKLNNHPRAYEINWSEFLRDSLELLRQYGCEIYVKDDLAKYASTASVALTPEERSADAHIVRR